MSKNKFIALICFICGCCMGNIPYLNETGVISKGIGFFLIFLFSAVYVFSSSQIDKPEEIEDV